MPPKKKKQSIVQSNLVQQQKVAVVTIPDCKLLFSKLYEQQDMLEEVVLFLDAPSLLKFARTSTTMYYYLTMEYLLTRIVKSRPFISKFYGEIISFQDLCTIPSNALAFLYNHDFMKSNIKNLKNFFETTFQTSSQNSSANVSKLIQDLYSKQLILPPDVVQWFLECKNFGVYEQGLRCDMTQDISVAPICWHFDKCENLVQIMTMSDCGSDGSSFIFVVCDPQHSMFARCVFYVYRRDR